MRCKKCGSINEIGAEICELCGGLLGADIGAETTISLPPVDVEEESKEINLAGEDWPILVVKKGPYIGQKFNLTKEEITLGRDPGSDIFLDDITVSRHHAKITVDKDVVSIEDSGSLNGTYVNQEIIEELKLLKSDDELQIGKFKLVYIGGRSSKFSKF